MSDNDLIRQGDVAKAITTLAQEFIDGGSPTAAHVLNLASDRINAIPAAHQTVKPLRYVEPEGETLDQMRDHARQHHLAQAGDMRLVWVNEGDLHIRTIFHAVQPTVSPKQLAAQPDDVAALLDAAEKVINSYWHSTDGVITGIYDLEAALARVKGETK